MINKRLPLLLTASLSLFLAACGPASVPSGINDPHEQSNRRIHSFNTGFDRDVVRPISNVYGDGVPSPLRRRVGNFAENVDTPRQVVNDVLQLRFPSAVHNTWRFVINTTVGIGGLFDPASKMGLTPRPTDFGETLHVWGVGEGNYQELPLIGPSTSRDTFGMVVDLALNPLTYVIPKPEGYSTTVAKGLSRLNDRYTYRTTVDSVLYESADSYAQTRTIYLQNRRYELRQLGRGRASIEDDYIDPYADDAASVEPAYDYTDPYEESQ